VSTASPTHLFTTRTTFHSPFPLFLPSLPSTLHPPHTYFQTKSTALKELGEIQKVLRRIPIIELNTPTVVLVGAPNVGKSTIVRAVSTGTPEVSDMCLCGCVFGCGGAMVVFYRLLLC